MIEVSFQGETHHCFANNPQSDAGSDTQDTNTMTSAAAASRQQNGGSTQQWENVPVCSLERPNAHKYTNTFNTDVEASAQILYMKENAYQTYSGSEDKNSCMHNISLLSQGFWSVNAVMI